MSSVPVTAGTTMSETDIAPMPALEPEQERERSRSPYTGSCHCGAIRYVVFLTLPLEPVDLGQPWHLVTQHPTPVIYRCNCTTCHKTGFLHMRINDAAANFMVLSPLDPLAELSDYQCNSKRLHWLFCKTCGIRCFTFAGHAEVAERDLGALGVPGEESGKLTKVWAPKDGAWKEGKGGGCYLSVNANTLDAGQGLDLREWTEKKLVMYLDVLTEPGQREKFGYTRPHVGGCY